jgi:hypothetical protein
VAETLREFLVSIGYSVGSDREWTRSLANVDKVMANLGGAILSLEKSLEKILVQVTDALDQAAWSATRVHSSISNLEALAYALKQTGRAADPVSAFAAQLRRFPNTEAVIQRLGVQTRANGELRDLTELLLDAVDATRKQDYVVGAHHASLLGLTEADYEHLIRNGPMIRDYMAERKRIAAEMGHDPDRLGLGSVVLMQGYRRGMMQINVALLSVASAVIPVIGSLVSSLDAWVKENHEPIREFIVRLTEVGLDLIAAFGHFIASFAPAAGKVGELVGAASDPNGLVPTIEIISGLFFAGVILQMLGALGRVRLAFLALVATVVTGRYVAPKVLDIGVREAPMGPDERPRMGMVGRAVQWVKEKVGLGPRGGGSGETAPAGATVTDRGGGDPGTQAIPATATTYSPQRGGDRMEGGYAAARKGPDGTAIVRTLEDYRQGRSAYATIAASRRFFGRKYTIPSVTYRVNGKTYTLKNVPVYVNDTGSAFAGAPEGRIDVPIDRDLGHGDTNQGLRNIELKPGWAPPPTPTGGASLEERTERRQIKMTAPWGDPSTKTKAGPLIEQHTDESSVTMTKTTRITVHGDTSPGKTADDVAKAQSAANSDMISTTEKAIP